MKKRKKNKLMFERFQWILKNLDNKELGTQFLYFTLPDNKIMNRDGETYKEVFKREHKNFKPIHHSKLQKKMIRTGKLL